jgi:hypothetical protein
MYPYYIITKNGQVNESLTTFFLDNTFLDIARTAVTKWKSGYVTLAGYCYAMWHGMKVQIVNPYRVSHLQPYGVTERGKVTSVYQL